MHHTTKVAMQTKKIGINFIVNKNDTVDELNLASIVGGLTLTADKCNFSCTNNECDRFECKNVSCDGGKKFTCNIVTPY